MSEPTGRAFVLRPGEGRAIDLGSRHKALNEKYREKYRQLGLIE